MNAKSAFYILLILFMMSSSLNAQNQIPFSVIASGGDRISNANFILSGTLGEVFTGLSAGTSNKSASGFWYIYHQDIITSADEDDELIPAVFKLEQNYPNPFNPVTIIKFGIAEKCHVLIKVYDILGGELLTLYDQDMEPGWYKKEFDASGMASGIYIYRINAGKFVSTKKMMMVK